MTYRLIHAEIQIHPDTPEVFGCEWATPWVEFLVSGFVATKLNHAYQQYFYIYSCRKS